jgi:truncated hemoglobin YjbI
VLYERLMLFLVIKAVSVLCVLFAAFIVYKLRKFNSNNDPNANTSGGKKPATEGVSGTYSTRHPWWREGLRDDTKFIYDTIGPGGIHDLSEAFYHRVYADDEEPYFRDMFKQRATLQDSVNRQTQFFMQMWGGVKEYTATNKPHFLRSIIGDHAGMKMFAKHDLARQRGQITESSAARWMHHMDGALDEQSIIWTSKYGEEKAKAVEKTVRWFLDHVLERMVWGAPVKV